MNAERGRELSFILLLLPNVFNGMILMVYKLIAVLCIFIIYSILSRVDLCSFLYCTITISHIYRCQNVSCLYITYLPLSLLLVSPCVCLRMMSLFGGLLCLEAVVCLVHVLKEFMKFMNRIWAKLLKRNYQIYQKFI